MNIQECLRRGAPDAELLLAFAMNKNREFLFAHPEFKIKNYQLKKYRSYLRRRSKGEPYAYIVGFKEFFGLKFIVDKNVLIPRPETETLVENAIDLISKDAVVVDVGTGSGAIAVALARHVKNRIIAIDNSISALKIARKNAKIHGVDKRIEFFKGNLLFPLKLKPCRLVIAANLPYVKTSELKFNYEPIVAFGGGKDGLKVYKELLEQIKKFKDFSIVLLLEIDPRQAKFFRQRFQIVKDLSGRDRVAIAKFFN